MPDLVGYGVCGPGEADKWLDKTLDSLKICDEVVIVTNNATQAEKDMIDDYGYKRYEDNREWGKHQHVIKQRLLDDHIAPLDPDWCICMDMDEELDPELDKQALRELEQYGEALYVWIVDLWEDGYKPKRCFWNIRAYQWDSQHRNIKGQPLHCGLAPEWAYHHAFYSPFYHLHYGLKTKELRQQKIDRYDKYDPDADYIHKEYYESLHEDDYAELDLDEIKSELKREWEQQNKPDIKKVKSMSNQETYYRVKRLSDGKEMPIKESNLQDVLKREDPEFEKLGKWHSEDDKSEDKEFKCPICGQVCKSKAGLSSHKASH